jgi:hypothetical protein
MMVRTNGVGDPPTVQMSSLFMSKQSYRNRSHTPWKPAIYIKWSRRQRIFPTRAAGCENPSETGARGTRMDLKFNTYQDNGRNPGSNQEQGTVSIPAIYEDGVFRPLGAVEVQTGTLVDVHVRTDFEPKPSRRSIMDLPFYRIWNDRTGIGDGIDYVNSLRDNPRH